VGFIDESLNNLPVGILEPTSTFAYIWKETCKRGASFYTKSRIHMLLSKQTEWRGKIRGKKWPT